MDRILLKRARGFGQLVLNNTSTGIRIINLQSEISCSTFIQGGKKAIRMDLDSCLESVCRSPDILKHVFSFFIHKNINADMLYYD